MSILHGRSRLAGTLTALLAMSLVPAGADAKSASQHYLGVYKVEQNFNLDDIPDVQQRTVACSGSDLAIDGMWRVDNVPYNAQVDEQGPYDAYNGVDVLRANSDGASTYTFDFANRSESSVDVKAWTLCLPKSTQRADPTPVHDTYTLSSPDTSGHLHQWSLDALSLTGTGGTRGADGSVEGTSASCATGKIAVAPGFDLTGGTDGDAPAAKMYKRMPSGTVSNWTLGFWAAPLASVNVSTWCLNVKTSQGMNTPPTVTKNHVHKLIYRIRKIDWNVKGCTTYSHTTNSCAVQDYLHVNGHSAGESNRVSTPQLDCGETEKAALGAFDLRTAGLNAQDPYVDGSTKSWWWMGQDDTGSPSANAHQLHFLGMDPRPKSRNFRIDNIGTADSQPLIEAVCVNDRSGKRFAP